MRTPSDLPRGRRVNTPLGPGNVAYVRTHPPLYATVAAVSVVLDSQRHRLDYAGTTFPEDQVSDAAEVTP